MQWVFWEIIVYQTDMTLDFYILNMPNIGGSRKPSNRYRRDEIKAYRPDMFSKTKPYMVKMVIPTRYDATMKVCFHL